MKFLAVVVVLATFGTHALADDLSARGHFASLSASAIATQLPSNADDFSALARQVGGVTITVQKDLLDVDAINGSLLEIDGWRNNDGGFIGAGGFADVRGFFKN